MPSDRKQINVRVDDATDELLRQLLPAVGAAIGLQVSQSDLFRLGLLELKKKYLAETAPGADPGPAAERPPAKKAKPKK